MSENCSGQTGVIKKIDNNEYHVEIINRSACSGCHAKGACMVMDEKAKTIIVDAEGEHKVGDTVSIEINNSLGLQAVFFGYFFPFLLVVLILIGLTVTGLSEITSGLISLAILFPYYVILFLFRKRLKKKFSFKLKS